MHGFSPAAFLCAFLNQGAQGFIQQQDLRFIDNRSGNGNSLLLPAGKGGNIAFFKAFRSTVARARLTFSLISVRDNFSLRTSVCRFYRCRLRRRFSISGQRQCCRNIQMGKQCITLENGINRPLVGRQITDVLAV
jgi:hypothetical protein